MVSKEVRDTTRKSFTTEHIIHKLREAEVIIAKGKKVPEALRQIGASALSCSCRLCPLPGGWRRTQLSTAH